MLVPVLDLKMERGHMETRSAGIALVSMVRKITNKITILAVSYTHLDVYKRQILFTFGMK